MDSIHPKNKIKNSFQKKIYDNFRVLLEIFQFKFFKKERCKEYLLTDAELSVAIEIYSSLYQTIQERMICMCHHRGDNKEDLKKKLLAAFEENYEFIMKCDINPDDE